MLSVTMFAMARSPDPRAKAIEDLLFQMGESARWLAEKIGKRHSTVNGWLSGAKPHDPQVWDQMLHTLREHEKSLNISANTRLRRTPRLTLPVLPLSVDVSEYLEDEPTGVYPTVTIANPENGRRHWTRPVTDTALQALANPADILVFDDRSAEIGNLVEVAYQGKARLGILGGTTAAPTLINPNSAYPDVIASDFAVVGVAWMRIRQLTGGIRESLEYEFGMRL